MIRKDICSLKFIIVMKFKHTLFIQTFKIIIQYEVCHATPMISSERKYKPEDQAILYT